MTASNHSGSVSDRTGEVVPSVNVMEKIDVLVNMRKQLYAKAFRLGPVEVKLYVPSLQYSALDYLCDKCDGSGSPDFKLVMIDLDYIKNIRPDDFLELSDATFRSMTFSKGFYLNHQFGEKVIKITRETSHYIIGRNLAKVMWIYYVKYFLTRFAINKKLLHLKAAAVVDGNDKATLIVGKQSGGKTVLLNALIDRGFRFLSNTHILLDGDKVYGINSAVRMRDDGIFTRYIQSGNAKEHFEAGDFMVEPVRLYGHIAKHGYLANIVIANYGQPEKGVHLVEPEFGGLVIKNFAHPISAWGMKDDYLEIMNGSLFQYRDIFLQEMSCIDEICRKTNNVHANFDIKDRKQLDELIGILK